jgi:hypothetical protein
VSGRDGAAPRGDATAAFRTVVLALLLAAVASCLWGIGRALPEVLYAPIWVLDEHGNQLLRADLLTRGLSLYGDLECQYGPLPIWAWYGMTRLLGNTMAANVFFHNLSALAVVAALFWWATRCTARRSTVLAIAGALAILAFARTPYCYLLLAPLCNIEYLSVERLCLIALVALWSPPDRRGAARAFGMVAVFGAWQLTKISGACFGFVAFAIVDGLWVLSRRPLDVRRWLRWWGIVGAGTAGIEVLRIAVFVALFGREIGLRTAWPLYVAVDYAGTWLTLWAGWRHFMAVVLPIVSLLAAAVWKLSRVIRRGSADSTWTDPLYWQAAVATAFYVLGLLPFVGFFGHEWLFFQYQWALLPFGLALVDRRPVWAAILIALHVGPLNRAVSEVRRRVPAAQLETLTVRGGTITARIGDPQIPFIRAALAEVDARRPAPTLIASGSWGGGGWYFAAGESRLPRNPFFNSAGARRPEDNEEFAALLRDAGTVLLATRARTAGLGAGWFPQIAGAAAASELRAFSESAAAPGWVLLARSR